MPESPPPTRRRNARTAHESGAKRSEFWSPQRRRCPAGSGPHAAAANARRSGARCGGGAATRSPAGGNSRFGRRPRFADPLRGVAGALSPARRKFVRKVRDAPRCFLFARRGQCRFRPDIARLGRADPRRTALEATGQRRPRRRRRAAQGVEDQNKSGDCGARARPLMSAGGTVARGGAQPRATGGQHRLVGRRAMARFLH